MASSNPPFFVFPSHFADLESDDDGGGNSPQRLCVQFPVDISTLRPSDLEELVQGTLFDLSDKDLHCVEEQQIFDRLYSLVKRYSCLNHSSRLNLVEALRSNLGVLIPSIESLAQVQSLEGSSDSDSPPSVAVVDKLVSYRNALRIYTFLLLSIVSFQEDTQQESKRGGQSKKKNAATKGWNWEHQRGRILGLIATSLEINVLSLFGSSEVDENYLSFVTRCVFPLFGSQTLLKDAETKDALFRIVGTVSTKHNQSSQSSMSILHLVYKFDFAVPYLADVVAMAEKKYSDGTLAVSLIREIGCTDPKDYVRDTTGSENVGRFLVELADRSPKTMATNIGVLVPHFGGESYKIRNALVSLLGKLVVKAFKDVDGDLSSNSLRLRGKQAMLEVLLERCRDVSAYTRSRVLQVWAELCEERAISIAHWNEVASVAAGRLEDKNTIVRKSALNLLITMLQHNPFGPQLRIAGFEETLEKFREELHRMEAEDVSDGVPRAGSIFKEPERNQQESVSDSLLPCDEVVEEKETEASDVGSFEQTRVLVASLDAGLRFIKCITSTLPTLVQLLASSSASDVENAILLLMRCRQFQIDGSEACLRKMFPLVFSQCKSISEAVENAFILIYVTKNPGETAENLLNLAIDSNIGDLAALEFLISSLMSKGQISTSMISALWDFFNFNVNKATAVQSQGALSILCMAAKSRAGILSSHMHDIIDIGFGRWARDEPLLARTACVALERLSMEDKEKLRSYSGRKLFDLLQKLITSSWLPDHIWYSAVDKAISFIYSIHPAPEIFAAEIIQRSLRSLFSGCIEDADGNKCGSTGLSFTVSISNLSRYLFVVSHIALCQLVYIESCVRKIQKQKSRREKEEFASQKEVGVCVTVTPADSDKDGISAELGLSVSEDALIDEFSERAEKEILSSCSNEKNLIGNTAGFLSKLCRNYTLMQKFPELQASAMLALCRLMIIDADFCEKNLQLLFTVVEGSPSETVRSNCTVALGDLAVRFPNLMESWTENMYAKLSDPSPSVRKNAVLVLSHLILNDMMKVKGFINEMAIRLEDKDERISNLAKLFFHELSKKGNNPVYNLLPDILGRLSNQNLNNVAFCNIMHFLINSIKKDKQMDALVEKLCNRFSGVMDTRQWKDIAYCLSQLTFTERGMKKFMDSIKSYEHVLGEDSVIDHFKNIVNKAKKFSKPEHKSCIEEFENKLHKIHVEMKEQEITAKNAQAYQNKLGNIKELLVSEDNYNEVETSEIIDPSEDSGNAENDSISERNSTTTTEECSSTTIPEVSCSVELQSPNTSRKAQGIKKLVINDRSRDASTRRITRSTKR